MSEYDEQVQAQRLKLEAEEWAKGVKSLHSHSLKSMWYDTRPQDTDDGPVSDVEYLEVYSKVWEVNIMLDHLNMI